MLVLELELCRLLAMSILVLRSVPCPFAVAVGTTVKRIRPIVLNQLPALTRERVDLSMGHAIGHSSDCLAKVRRVVLLILVRVVEALNNVYAIDFELLDERAEGQEGEAR